MSLGQPSPPSPSASIGAATQAAQAQLPFSSAAQRSSMVNQTGPTGSLSYKITGYTPQGTPIYTANTSYSPEQQQLYQLLTGTQKQAGSQAAGALGFGDYGTVDPTQKIGDIATGLTGQGVAQGVRFLSPFFDTQQQQLDTQLRNQGLTPGNPAYDVAMRQMRTTQGLQVNNLVSSLFPQEQQFAMSEYGLPMKTAEGLATFGAPTSPTTGFTSALPGFTAPSVGSDLSSMVQANQNEYQAKQAQYNALMSAIGGIGGSILGGPVGSAAGGWLGSVLAGGPGNAGGPMSGWR